VACVARVTPNLDTLAALLLSAFSDDAAATVFNEIRRVESSQALIFGCDGVVESAQETLAVAPRIGSPDELAEELRAILHRVVRRSIEGRNRVAVLASGGLDSSCILAHATAIARGAQQPEIDAITLSFAGPGDDRPYINEMCRSLGIVPLRISPSEASSNVLKALVADAAPLPPPTAAWNLTLRERARERGADAVLTGVGGDQVFNGDPRIYSRQLLSRGCGAAILRTARFYIHSPKIAPLRAARMLLTPWLSSIAPDLTRVRFRRSAARRWPCAGPRMKDFISHNAPSPEANCEWLSPTNETRLRRIIASNFLRVAEIRGQMESASGVMRIDPLIDDELVTFIASVSQETLLHGDRQRGLFRLALRQILPERVRLRVDKARFEPAIAQMVHGSDLGALRDLASVHALRSFGLVEAGCYRRQFNAILRAGSTSAQWNVVWPALAVEAFARSRWPAVAGRVATRAP
jgi:asparagine synthase (glutamine-hydrolysing)